jgi:uncharacterized protein (TIGR02270 family)
VIVPAVLQQHADDAVALAEAREALVTSADATLEHLQRADQRLVAHLYGLKLAGNHGTVFCNALLERPSSGALFTVTARALEQKDDSKIEELIALVRTVPEPLEGLLAAFGWVQRSGLRGTVAKLLGDRDPFRRMIGITSCSMHGANPGSALRRGLEDADGPLRARALRTIGELGLRELESSCGAALGADDPDLQFWGAWSAVLLGDRSRGLKVLTACGRVAGRHAEEALRLALQAMEVGQAHRVLRELKRDPAQLRQVIQGSGIGGDPVYVPWLIEQMADNGTARLAGEAFALICGLDLSVEALDRPAPPGFESGPADNPDDPDVDMDPDDGLSWPDVAKIEGWWAANASRFQKGTRYFMGKAVTRDHCIGVLKNGYQRQRILAAQYLCLLDPGTPLFNTSAPAWRQQKRLAEMA